MLHGVTCVDHTVALGAPRSPCVRLQHASNRRCPAGAGVINECSTSDGQTAATVARCVCAASSFFAYQAVAVGRNVRQPGLQPAAAVLRNQHGFPNMPALAGSPEMQHAHQWSLLLPAHRRWRAGSLFGLALMCHSYHTYYNKSTSGAPAGGHRPAPRLPLLRGGPRRGLHRGRRHPGRGV